MSPQSRHLYRFGDWGVLFFVFAFAGVFLTALPFTGGFAGLLPVIFALVPTVFFDTAVAFAAGAVILPEAVVVFTCTATDFFTANPVFLEVF